MMNGDKEIDMDRKEDVCVKEFTVDPVEHFIALGCVFIAQNT